jgi:hypothetical protein
VGVTLDSLLSGEPILTALLLYCSIGLLPLWIFPVHVSCQRLLAAFKPDIGVQASALVAAAVVNVIYAAFLLAWFLVGLQDGNSADAVAAVLFVMLAVNAMAFFYFQFVNMALTSIHMAVLFRVYWLGELSQEALMSQYDDRLMVAERLRRLVQLRQVELRDGVMHLRSNVMVVLATPVFLWRRILGWTR